jgi:hypothetical protein
MDHTQAERRRGYRAKLRAAAKQPCAARIRAYRATARWVMEDIESLLGEIELSGEASERMADALLELVNDLTRAARSLRASWSRTTGDPRGTKAP